MSRGDDAALAHAKDTAEEVGSPAAVALTCRLMDTDGLAKRRRRGRVLYPWVTGTLGHTTAARRVLSQTVHMAHVHGTCTWHIYDTHTWHMYTHMAHVHTHTYIYHMYTHTWKTLH